MPRPRVQSRTVPMTPPAPSRRGSSTSSAPTASASRRRSGFDLEREDPSGTRRASQRDRGEPDWPGSDDAQRRPGQEAARRHEHRDVRHARRLDQRPRAKVRWSVASPGPHILRVRAVEREAQLLDPGAVVGPARAARQALAAPRDLRDRPSTWVRRRLRAGSGARRRAPARPARAPARAPAPTTSPPSRSASRCRTAHAG